MQDQYGNDINREDPVVVIKGMEEPIKKDLHKHEGILERTKTELSAFRSARAHERLKKKHYEKLIGGGKFNDTALKNGITQIEINMRHFSDKVKTATAIIEFEQGIVDKLKEALEDQYKGLRYLEGLADGATN